MKGLTRDRSWSYCFIAVFSARRLAIVFCIFFLKEENYLPCILGLIATQLVYLLYLVSTRPHIDENYNYLELFNETSVLMLFYGLQGFSTSSLGPLVEPINQWTFGYVSIGVICLIYVVNFALMLGVIYKKSRELYWKIVKYKQKKKLKAKNKQQSKMTLREITRIVYPELLEAS